MPKTLSNFAQRFDDMLSDVPTFEEVEGASGVFKEALDAHLYLDAMHKLLSRNLDGGFEVTPDISSGPFIVLYGSRKSTWAVLRHTGRSRCIYLSPTHSIAAKVAGGRLEASRYGVDRPFKFTMLDRSLTLEQKSASEVHNGQLIMKNGEFDVIDLQSTGAPPAFTLRVNTLPFDDYEWAFDRSTLNATSISGVHQAESNLTTILDLLAAVGSPDSIDHVQRFTDHSMHFVRWKAAQTLCALNRDTGLDTVHLLMDDPHPEVRAAAKRTLTVAA